MQESSGKAASPIMLVEQFSENYVQTEHSPEEARMSRAPFSFWKEIDFQTVLM
jgi:hypothetical protein